MRVIYYTYPAFFDVSLCFIRSLSKRVELYVILEVTPESRKGTILDLTDVSLSPGVTPANLLLGPLFPDSVRAYWENVSGFYIAYFESPKSIHPDTFRDGKAITGLMHQIEPDLIYFDDISLRISMNSFFLRKIPWVIGVHDPEPHSGEGNWRIALSRKIMYSKAVHFVTHNQFQQANFLARNRIPPARSSVIRLGVIDVYRNFGNVIIKTEEKTVLFFGRISPYKGLEILLQAASSVCQQLEQVTIVIAGKPIAGYTLPVMPKLSNGGEIQLVDRFITNRELVQFFSKATCIVCPYTDATQSAVVLTAYAFEKPVIVSRVGGLPEYVLEDETGLLFTRNDPRALSDVIINVLTDAELREKLERGCSTIQREYLNWEKISEKYIEVFNKVSSDE
jgi:glycosyltransferase involved in cell wall biosynthesis